MNPKSSTSRTPGGGRGRRGGERWADLLTPARVLLGIVAILTLVFIFENTRHTEIRVLIPEVTMPLWLALLVTAVIGFVCGGYVFGRRR
jgi:uncharacterized integral membrane protein